MAAACLFFHALLPAPAVNEVTSKLRFFAAHKDEFDTVFLGTSRFHYQVSPEIFDETTRAGGFATHTFNFGIDGMHPPESFYVIEQFLKLNPRRLHWVFLEFEDTQLKWTTAKRGTRRVVYWHDWKRTALALQKSLNQEGRSPLFRQIARVWPARESLILHLGLYLQRFGNVGTASDLLGVRSEDDVAELGRRRDGYRASGGPMPAAQARDFAEKLAREVSHKQPGFVDPYAEAAYRDCARRIREAGALPIFVVTPVLSQSPLYFRNPPEPPGPIFAFNDAETFPQFYDPGTRLDESHLTRVSAEAFTRLLAERFTAEMPAAR